MITTIMAVGKTWVKDLFSFFLMLWMCWQSLANMACWLYGVYSLYKNKPSNYRRHQQLSRRRTVNVLRTVAALFCIVTTSKNFFSSRIPTSVPNASSMLEDDMMDSMKNVSKYPEMIRWICYASISHVTLYNLCANICTEALNYYMFNNIDFQKLFSFSTSKELLDSSQEQEKEPSGLRLSVSIHLGRTRIISSRLEFGGQRPSLYSPS